VPPEPIGWRTTVRVGGSSVRGGAGSPSGRTSCTMPMIVPDTLSDGVIRTRRRVPALPHGSPARLHYAIDAGVGVFDDATEADHTLDSATWIWWRSPHSVVVIRGDNGGPTSVLFPTDGNEEKCHT